MATWSVRPVHAILVLHSTFVLLTICGDDNAMRIRVMKRRAQADVSSNVFVIIILV